jgi:hypothetical protein
MHATSRERLRIIPVLLAVLTLPVQLSRADTPPGFSWVNLETNSAVMTAVRGALHDTSITAIREVGVEDGFALVMTASRESGAPTPDFDQWTLYNVSLSSRKSQVLVSGYGVQLLDWIGSKQDELAIAYYDCWECEAARLFTTLHFKTGVGWRARWANKIADWSHPQPGILMSTSDVPDSLEEEVDIVFAVVSTQENGSDFAVGSWVQSRSPKSKSVVEDVVRYSIDPATGEDRKEKLSGQEALKWEAEICDGHKVMLRPNSGQDSKACRTVLKRLAGLKNSSH